VRVAAACVASLSLGVRARAEQGSVAAMRQVDQSLRVLNMRLPVLNLSDQKDLRMVAYQ
jgi:hypothetical protein